MLEITVDAVLLHHRPGAGARLLAWEESAKLKHAEAVAKAYGGSAVPRGKQEAVAFASRDAARVNALRVANGWVTKAGNPRHPDRWTTHNLPDDAADADRLEPGLELHKTYLTEFGTMCWGVHGSGAIGVRTFDRDDMAGFAGLQLRLCTQLAVQYVKLLLRHAGIWNRPHRGTTWAYHFDALASRQAAALEDAQATAAR